MRARVARLAGRALGPLKPKAIDAFLSVMAAGAVVSDCNVCGTRYIMEPRELGREVTSCPTCWSTVRFRSVISALSEELFGEPMPIPAFPHRPDIVGVGLSDWEGYAERLPDRVSYTNTFLHEEPVLDVTDVPEEWAGRADFVLSSDVFEHVRPPVGDAFRGLRRLLKPGGLAVVTVPYGEGAETVEHYPELHDYTIEELADGAHEVMNRTAAGVDQRFGDPVFHGGEGLVLEMRVFSLPDVIAHLEEAGFRDIKVHRANRPAHGIIWSHGDGVPVTARAR